MEKAMSMGKDSAVGSFQLFIGKSLATIINGIGSVILARIMLPAEYGLYSLALVPVVMMNLFHDWGLNAAMIKYVVKYRSLNREEDIRDVLAVGLLFKFVTGLALSLISLFLANFIAVTIFNRPELSPLIIVASLAILSDSLFTASNAAFTGFERMKLRGLTPVCQSVLKSTIGPILVLVGFGAVGAVVSYTVAYVVAALLAVIISYFSIFKNLKKSLRSQTDKFTILKMLLRYGLPLSMSAILSGFLTQFYSLLMGIYCSDALIGNYSTALNFALVLSFFTFPISTVLFPAFSKLNPQDERPLLKKVFKSSTTYTAILLLPATLAIMVLAQPTIMTIFGERYVYAPFYLSLYVLVDLFTALGKLSLAGFLTGTGETKVLLKLTLLNIAIGVPLSFVLIPALEITGVILVTVFVDLPSQVLGLYWIWKKYGVTADWKASLKILVASVIAAVVTYLFMSILGNVEIVKLIVGTAIFLVTYLVVAPSIGAIIQDDIYNLRKMFSSLGVIFKIINIPLTLSEKIVRYNSRRKEKPHKN